MELTQHAPVQPRTTPAGEPGGELHAQGDSMAQPGSGPGSHDAHAGVSPPQAARIAGLAYMGLALGAFFANFFVLLRLVVPGDAAATAANLAASEGLFRAGIAGFITVFLLDMVVAWALHMYFRRVNADVSLLAAWFRLAYAAMFGIAMLNLVVAVQIAGSGGGLAALGAAGRESQALLFVDAFSFGWVIALVCFGAHLLVVSYLALRSGDVPRVLGVLLGLAGVGYALDGFAHVLLATYDDYAQLILPLVAVPSVLGEVGFAIWLLLRGGTRPVGPRDAQDAVAG